MDCYKLYVDAAADIPQELVKRYRINVLPIPVAIGDRSYQSGVELTNDEFYSLMDEYDGIPVTSQITPFEFEELYEREWKAGCKNLILILINSKGSATYGNATTVRKAFYEQHPEARDQFTITLFDGASYTAGYGYVAILAAQKLEMGMELSEVYKLIQEQLDSQCIYFGMYTLKYAGKSGRIPSAAVFVGEALGIKPIMKLYDHQIITAGKARGDKKLIKELLKMTLSDMEPKTPYCVIYGSDLAARDELTEEMTKKIGYPPVYQFQIGAAVAINAGPKMVGVRFEMRHKK
ncbi:MAG: DegV family protein [Eubacteriales bacterium]|nr:DegV family protein [Eubacteriales bacterium]